MRFTLLNFLMLFVAIAAIVAWRIDKTRFEHVLANYSEYQPESHWEEISDGDILDVVSIGDVAFVYCYSDISLDDSLETELKDLGLPSDAERNGRPNETVFALINELLNFKHQLSLENAIADGSGNSKYWKITWSLFPAQGGFSGVPYQYVGYVRSDGSAVPPRIYLRDHFGSWYDNQNDLLFSVLPIERLLPATDQSVDDQKFVDAATDHLNDALKSLDIKTKFRFDKINRRTFSQRLQLKSKKSLNDLEVWAVEFVDSSIPTTAKNVNSATRITVWVTSDLATSEISVGEWELDK